MRGRRGRLAIAHACLLGLFLAAGNAGAEPSAAGAATVLSTTPADPGVSRRQVGTVILYLGALAGVGYALVYYARRGFTMKASGATQAQSQSLRILATTRASPTLTISLLDVEGRRVLVAATASGTAIIELSKNAQA